MKTYTVTVFDGPTQHPSITLKKEDIAEAINAAKLLDAAKNAAPGAAIWVQRRGEIVRLEKNKRRQWVGGPDCKVCNLGGGCK